MFGLKKVLALGLALLVSNAAAQSCGAQQGNSSSSSNKPAASPPADTPAPAQKPSPPGQKGPPMTAQPLTISEGGYGPIEEPFFAVIRDAETYSTLRALLTNLPELRSDFFAAHTVIAAFLGTRPDRKSTRLNSSHANISYAVFCLKKKKKNYYVTIII